MSSLGVQDPGATRVGRFDEKCVGHVGDSNPPTEILPVVSTIGVIQITLPRSFSDLNMG